MIVHLHCLCWNEAAIIPHFLRHYGRVVSQFFILDNRSTDDSVALLQADPRVSVTPFDVPGDSFVLEEQRLSETVWQASRGEADWVIVVDMDEFLFHPDLLGYLRECDDVGTTCIRSIGYDMVADTVPEGPELLAAVVTRGVRSTGFDKLCLFKPQAVTQTRFTLGRHGAMPLGQVAWSDTPEVTMLHYKHLCTEYSQRRNAMLGTGLRARDVSMGWGRHYLRPAKSVDADFQRLRAQAAPVPGLPGGPPAGTLGAEERIIRASQRFDGGWYLAQYPDVAAAGVDPATHFHHHGWREGRRPNKHFNFSDWPDAAAATANPFLIYFELAEPRRLAG